MVQVIDNSGNGNSQYTSKALVSRVLTQTAARDKFLSGVALPDSLRRYAGQTLAFSSADEMLSFLQAVGDEVRRTGRKFVCFIELNRALAAGLMTINKGNREIDREHAKAMAQHMDSGEDWKELGDSLCISILPDGSVALGDGQHRMTALSVFCEKDHTFPFLVVVGIDQTDIAIAKDNVKSRTAKQRLRGLGYDVDKQDQAAMRMCALYPSTRSSIRATPFMLRDWADTYLEKIHLVRSWLKGLPTRFMRPPILAAVVRAMPYVKEDVLKRFCTLLADHTQVPEKGEEIIYRTRVLVAEGYSKGSEVSRIQMYQRAQNALYHFVTKSGVSVLRSTDADLFPLQNPLEE